MSKQKHVYIVTGKKWPDGEAGTPLLVSRLAELGVHSTNAVWDDPNVDWEAADLAIVRSTWDYQDNLPAFLEWARSLDPRLIHGADTFAWNTRKSYLIDLAAKGAPIVPTEHVTELASLCTLINRDRSKQVVVKPDLGASGIGVELAKDVWDKWQPAAQGPWVVQPLLESVFEEGETTLFTISGKITAQITKTNQSGDFRIQSRYGGTAQRSLITQEARELVDRVLTAAEATPAGKLDYARLDFLRHEGRLVLSELEVTEPNFGLDRLPENVAAMAEMLVRKLDSA